MDKYDEIIRLNKGIFENLIDMGLLDMRNGSITIHYDSAGEIKKIQKEEVTFHARFDR